MLAKASLSSLTFVVCSYFYADGARLARFWVKSPSPMVSTHSIQLNHCQNVLNSLKTAV